MVGQLSSIRVRLVTAFLATACLAVLWFLDRRAERRAMLAGPDPVARSAGGRVLYVDFTDRKARRQA